MLLGKRQRPRPQAMKRTSSLTEFYIESTTVDQNPNAAIDQRLRQQVSPMGASVGGYWSSMISPRNLRRNSGDFAVETAAFLKTCGLCQRRLTPGRDIYMYRGEIAFCSSECRQQQMAMDERKDNCPQPSRMNLDLPQPEPSTGGGTPDGAVAAA